jgi:phosphate/sulfate permease
MLKKKKIMTLKDIFENTNNWLKYAEAKHTVLIGLIGAGLFGIHNYADSFCNWKLIFQFWIILSVTLFVISCLVSLISFMPILYPLKRKRIKPNRELNLIYFKDIALTEPHEYLSLLNISDQDKISKSLAEQIIANSRIAAHKFNLFSVSLWLVLIGIFPPFFLILFIKCFIKGDKNDN